MKELLKWLQGVGLGVVYSLGEALLAAIQGTAASAPIGSIEQLLQVAVLAALARGAGWLVGQLPTRETL